MREKTRAGLRKRVVTADIGVERQAERAFLGCILPVQRIDRAERIGRAVQIAQQDQKHIVLAGICGGRRVFFAQIPQHRLHPHGGVFYGKQSGERFGDDAAQTVCLQMPGQQRNVLFLVQEQKNTPVSDQGVRRTIALPEVGEQMRIIMIGRCIGKVNERKAGRRKVRQKCTGGLKPKGFFACKTAVKQLCEDFFLGFGHAAGAPIGIKLLGQQTLRKQAVLRRRRIPDPKHVQNVAKAHTGAGKLSDGAAMLLRIADDPGAAALGNSFAHGQRQLTVRNGAAVAFVVKVRCGKGGDDVKGVVRDQHWAGKGDAYRLGQRAERIALQKSIQQQLTIHRHLRLC